MLSPEWYQPPFHPFTAEDIDYMVIHFSVNRMRREIERAKKEIYLSRKNKEDTSFYWWQDYYKAVETARDIACSSNYTLSLDREREGAFEKELGKIKGHLSYLDKKVNATSRGSSKRKGNYNTI